jgi:hypothetical protein
MTVSDDLRSALEELGEAMGKPAATVACALLTEMIPQLRDMAKVHRALAKGNTTAAKQALQHLLGDGMAEIITAQQADMFGKPKRKIR